MSFQKYILSGVLTATAIIGCQDKTQTETSNNFARAWCISGGPIYTANDDTPTIEAVAIRQGIKFAGGNSKTIDLKGAAAYPGFTDAHGHLLGIGLREMTLNLEGTESIEDLKSKLANVVASTPEGQSIYGRGWIETHWPEDRFPNRADLDAVTTSHPVILERADGHASVVNSLALEKANITTETENPFGGAINRDVSGEATGMLIDNAAGLVQHLMPELTEDRKREAYIRGADLYAARGWTNIHSMSVDPSDVSLLNSLARNKKIKIRVYNSLDFAP